jgi:hypothetical protein
MRKAKNTRGYYERIFSELKKLISFGMGLQISGVYPKEELKSLV